MIDLQEIEKSISEEVNNYLLRKIKRESVPSGTILYHYTDIGGVKGILENKCFRISRASFLNDSMEIKYIFKCLNETVSKLSIKENEFLKLIKKIARKFSDGEYDYNYFFSPSSIDSRYILSLTTNNDSLMLWSYYSNFDGYNIGIDFYEFMEEKEKKEDVVFLHGKVIYDIEKQQKLIKDELMAANRILDKYEGEVSEKMKKKLVDDLAQCFFLNMTILSSFFKHPSFKSEEEYRVVVTDYNKNMEVQYKVAKGLIIPYIEIKQKSNNLIPVKEITIGPKNNSDIAKQGIRSFTNSLGYTESKLEIGKSNVPLRY